MSGVDLQWLRDQLDEDERIVKAAPRGPWSMDGSGSIVAADGVRVIPSVGGALDGCATRWPEDPVVDYVLAYGPDRVLREIDAKRDLLRFAQGVYDHHETFTTGVASRLEQTLRLFALAYEHRPGFKEEWRP